MNEAEAQIFEFNFYAPYSIKLLNKTVEETQNMTLVFTDTEKTIEILLQVLGIAAGQKLIWILIG